MSGVPQVVALGEEGDGAARIEVANLAEGGTAPGDALQVGSVQLRGRGDDHPPVLRQARQALGEVIRLGTLDPLSPGRDVDDDAARGSRHLRLRPGGGRSGLGDDLGESGVDDEVASGRGMDDVGQDEVLAVTRLRGAGQQLPADDALTVLVERVVEEGPALEQGAAVRQERRSLLDGRVVRAVAVHGEGDLVGVAEVGEVAGETRLVPLDGVAVGGDRRHLLPVGTEGGVRQELAAHGDPVGLDVAGQLAPGQEGVGVHDIMLGHAPEGDVVPVLGAGENLLPGAYGGVVGVVGQDELVEVGEPVPTEVLQSCAVGADVEPLVGALDDLVA